MRLLGLSWSSKFLLSTAPESVGAVLTASTTETILVVLQSFGTILVKVVMTVLIMEPVSLELNIIRAVHNSDTDVALKPIALRTT